MPANPNLPSTSPIWTPAPERRLKELVSPSASWNADHLHQTLLETGLGALNALDTSRLILPPLAAARRAGSDKNLTRNRYLEVGIVTQGPVTLWLEGTLTMCPTGSVFLIPPGMRYLSHADPPEETPHPQSVVWLALHRGCAVVHRCRIQGRNHLLSEYYSLTDTRVTDHAYSIAQELTDRPEHYATVVRGSLLCLFTLLLRAPVHRISRHAELGDEAAEVDETSFSGRVESYLRSHYHRPLTLAQIARSIECSPAYLCRHFRELTGRTPFQYLRAVRLEAAKELLLSEVPIARISEMVGYDDPLYFSKVFSQQVGQSPQHYRAARRAEGVMLSPA